MHFKLDRPCSFHKQKGIKCGGCGKYTPVFFAGSAKKRILVIKLDAMGDVLRSTFLLPGLKEKYPKSAVTWITAPESVDILKGNPYISRILPFDKNIYSVLLSEMFDVVINLDLSPQSLALATLAFADKKIGFYLDSKRRVVSSNSFARQWLLMSAFDDVKKKNTRTYQYHMAKITGLPRVDYEIYTPLNKESLKKAANFAKSKKLNKQMVVGINPGAGKRWKLKKWTDAGYIKLINQLNKSGAKVLLFGGPQEEGLISKLVKQSKGKAISTGTNNSLPDFFALINLCDIFITGDTLALHAALGLKKKVVAIFGPTSAQEIEIYKRGVKIVSPVECACCYIPVCGKKPSCMDMIKFSDVWSALEKIGVR